MKKKNKKVKNKWNKEMKFLSLSLKSLKSDKISLQINRIHCKRKTI